MLPSAFLPLQKRHGWFCSLQRRKRETWMLASPFLYRLGSYID
uniref:Uncharacterized protein n=1 Tax=Arundo donax TaxID=35708 RepID=A0A0A8ZB38_ARUDO